MVYDRLVDEITRQQEGHENTVRFQIGEQLKDIARESDDIADILLKDLAVAELSLAAAEKKFDQYANANRGKEKKFCITPLVADGILRQMYGLPEANAKKEEASPHTVDMLDLNSFL